MRKVEPWMVWQTDWHSFDDGSFSMGRYPEDRSPLSCRYTRRNWNNNNIQFQFKSRRVKYVRYVVISGSSHDVTTGVVVESAIARVTALETVFHRGHVSQIIDFDTTRSFCFHSQHQSANTTEHILVSACETKLFWLKRIDMQSTKTFLRYIETVRNARTRKDGFMIPVVSGRLTRLGYLTGWHRHCLHRWVTFVLIDNRTKLNRDCSALWTSRVEWH